MRRIDLHMLQIHVPHLSTFLRNTLSNLQTCVSIQPKEGHGPIGIYRIVNSTILPI